MLLPTPAEVVSDAHAITLHARAAVNTSPFHPLVGTACAQLVSGFSDTIHVTFLHFLR
jgi:hypothetical protein